MKMLLQMASDEGAIIWRCCCMAVNLVLKRAKPVCQDNISVIHSRKLHE